MCFILYCLAIAIFISARVKVPQILGLLVPVVYLTLVGTRDPLLVPDTESYLDFFLTLDIENIFDFTPNANAVVSFKPGFIILSKVINLFSGASSIVFLLAIAAINVIILLVFGRKIAGQANEISLYEMTREKLRKMEYWDSLLILILYISYYGFLYNAIVLRQGIAMSLILLGTPFLLARRFVLPAILLLLSFTMHSSSYIGIIIYLIILSKANFNIEIYRFVYGVSLVIYLTRLGNIIAPKLIGLIEQYGMFFVYESHIERAGFTGLISLRNLFFYLLGLIFLLKEKRNPYFYFYLNVYLTGLFLLAVFSGIDWISRATDYFIIFSFVLVYYEIKELKNGSLRIMLANFVLICQAVLVYRILTRIGV